MMDSPLAVNLLWLLVCILVATLTSIMVRAGLHRRLSIVEAKVDGLEKTIPMIREEAHERYILMVDAITRTVKSALSPISERLDRVDREMSEIKDMCSYLVTELKPNATNSNTSSSG